MITLHCQNAYAPQSDENGLRALNDALRNYVDEVETRINIWNCLQAHVMREWH